MRNRLAALLLRLITVHPPVAAAVSVFNRAITPAGVRQTGLDPASRTIRAARSCHDVPCFRRIEKCAGNKTAGQ